MGARGAPAGAPKVAPLLRRAREIPPKAGVREYKYTGVTTVSVMEGVGVQLSRSYVGFIATHYFFIIYFIKKNCLFFLSLISKQPSNGGN